jgi:hypothetical protein
MVAGAIAGNISAEATTPTGNTFAEAMRGFIHRVLRITGGIFLSQAIHPPWILTLSAVCMDVRGIHLAPQAVFPSARSQKPVS